MPRCLAIHAYGNLQIASGDGLYIIALLTVRSCTIMYCTYMYVFSVNKYCLKPSIMTFYFHGFSDSFINKKKITNKSAAKELKNEDII